VDGRDKPGHDALRRESKQCLVQILPFGIHAVDEAYLPGTRPVFDRLFALDCGSNVIVVLVIDEHFQAIPLRKAINEPFPVLVSTTRQIVGNAAVKRSIPSIGHDVNPPAHVSFLRVSPANPNPEFSPR
jgi:hypothetical protein